MIARIVTGLLLGIWLAGGLLLTLSPVYPAPGQVVELTPRLQWLWRAPVAGD